jgi:hypothetical protein
MLKSQTKQSSFYDTDYICEQLILEDSFYRRFRDVVSSLIKDKQFRDKKGSVLDMRQNRGKQVIT